MRKHKIFKKAFAIFSLVLLISVFALNTFAYSPPVIDPETYGFNFEGDNVLTYNQFEKMDYIGDGGTTVVTAELTGHCVYVPGNTPTQIFSRFDTPILLEGGKTYVLFWFVLSNGFNFQAENFRVYDGQFVFNRGFSSVQYSVNNLTLNGDYVPCYYNIVSIPSGTSKEIYSLACEYRGEINNPVVFVPFIVEISEGYGYYIGGEESTLNFYYPSNYQCNNASFTDSQLFHIVTAQNTSIYTFQEGYNEGLADGQRDKANYGEQQRQQGYQDGIRYEKGKYAQNLANAKTEGYNLGFADGENSVGRANLTFSNMIITVLESPFQVARTIFDFDLLDINLAGFFFSLLTLIIFIRLVKTFV